MSEHEIYIAGLRAEKLISRGIRENAEQTFTPDELSALRAQADALRAQNEKLEREAEAAASLKLKVDALEAEVAWLQLQQIADRSGINPVLGCRTHNTAVN